MAQAQATLTEREVESLNREMEGRPPQAVLEWGLKRFHPRISLSSSFGAEDVVLIDMLWRIDPQARVFTLDTLRLPTETYTLIDQIRQRYSLNLEVFYPRHEPGGPHGGGARLQSIL